MNLGIIKFNNKGVPMTKDELISTLASVKEELQQRFGIEKIALFGSYARDEATDNSDVDIVILEIKEKNFLNRLNAIDFLENKLNQKVDMGYFDSMKTFIKNRIRKDFIYV